MEKRVPIDMSCESAVIIFIDALCVWLHHNTSRLSPLIWFNCCFPLSSTNFWSEKIVIFTMTTFVKRMERSRWRGWVTIRERRDKNTGIRMRNAIWWQDVQSVLETNIKSRCETCVILIVSSILLPMNCDCRLLKVKSFSLKNRCPKTWKSRVLKTGERE